MTDLKAIWASLPSPSSKDGLSFTTAEIPDVEGVRLGRGTAGPALLFEVTEPPVPRAPIELKNLSARFHVTCRVEHERRSTQGRFTVVVCTSPNANLHGLFLDALEPLLGSVAGTSDSIPRIIESLVELFRRLDRSPQTSIPGLWGELFTIAIAKDPDPLLLAWHQLPNDHYDFAQGSDRLEVKTTVGHRSHTFSLEQLRPPNGISLWIYSIVTESSAAGSTILDLVTLAAARCTTPDAASRLMEGAVQALGADVSAWKSTRYDLARAVESRRLLPGSAIPCVSDPPSEVSKVKFEADLTGVDAPPPDMDSPVVAALIGP